MAKTARERQVQWLAKMKEQLRCVACGRQDERTIKGLVKCAVCAEKDKEWYRRSKKQSPEKYAQKNVEKQDWRKQLRENHLCVDCSQQDAFTLGGRPKCEACTKKDAKRKELWRADNRELAKTRVATIRRKWVEGHKCSACGHPLPFDYSFKTCQRCREHGKERKDERAWKDNPDRIKRGTPGICYICVKRPVMDGKKMCKVCYEQRLPISLANVKKAQEKNANHIWRKL